MISFIFGVLGSVLFWVVFGVMGFVLGSVMLKHLFSEVFEFITTGKRYDRKCTSKDRWRPSNTDAFIALFAVFVLWPLVLLWIIVKFIVVTSVKLTWPLFCKAVKVSANIVPKVTIEKEE